MIGFIILFYSSMVDFRDNATREWLRRLSLDGRLISIDEIKPLTFKTGSIKNSVKGFAIINAKDSDELNTLLSSCPKLKISELEIYELSQ